MDVLGAVDPDARGLAGAQRHGAQPGRPARTGPAGARHDEGGGDLAILDHHLAGRPYLAGDDFSIGDMPAAIWTYRWYAMDIGRPALTNLEAWAARLVQRPAYREHVMLPLS